MPLNGTTYLVQHGWAGKGVPLDGERGRGLKKPIALPMKRNVKGLGKERDRATEWWDCVFEAGAKKMQGEKPAESNVANAEDGFSTSATRRKGSLSLVSMAKRQHARKMLMTGFIRGRETEYERQEREMAALIVSRLDGKEESSSSKKEEKELRREKKRKEGGVEAAVTADKKGKKRKRAMEGTSPEGQKTKAGQTPDKEDDKEARRVRRKQRRAEKELRRSAKEEMKRKKADGVMSTKKKRRQKSGSDH
jgi:nucleolar protein TMA23